MKKSLILFTAVLFCLSGIAKDLGGTWVITGEGKLDCKKVIMGYNKARIVLENGQKATVALNMISSLSMNGRVFTKLPLYENGKPTNQMAFMELIKTWNSLSLYKFGYHDLGSSNLSEVTYRYFLYTGRSYFLALDDRTLANTCLHFGLNANEL